MTLSCDEIEEGALVYHDGKETKWAFFKQRHQNWKFSSNSDQKDINRKKNMKIWNLIG